MLSNGRVQTKYRGCPVRDPIAPGPRHCRCRFFIEITPCQSLVSPVRLQFQLRMMPIINTTAVTTISGARDE